ncbi:MAG: hypothetical protein QXX79_00415 [Candidatus Bathyarchaeia archaeon]
MHQSINWIGDHKTVRFGRRKTDLIVGCLGGGSNFGGIALPFLGEVLMVKRECEFLAAQSLAAPNLVEGEYRYDFCDAAEYTPLLKVYTLGHKVEMPPIKLMAYGIMQPLQ